MHLKIHLSNLDVPARNSLAEQCGTSRGHIQNIAYGYRTCAPALAVSIEKATKGLVTRQELLPEEWPGIWPELLSISQVTSSMGA